MLVFRRPADTDIEAFAPKLLEASEIETVEDTPETEEPDTQAEYEDDADNAPTPTKRASLSQINSGGVRRADGGSAP